MEEELGEEGTKDKNVQYNIEYKVRSHAEVQLHCACVDKSICPASRCSQFVPLESVRCSFDVKRSESKSLSAVL